MGRMHDNWMRMGAKWGSAYYRFKESGCRAKQAAKWADKVCQRAINETGEEALVHMVTDDEVKWALNKMPKVRTSVVEDEGGYYQAATEEGGTKLPSTMMSKGN